MSFAGSSRVPGASNHTIADGKRPDCNREIRIENLYLFIPLTPLYCRGEQAFMFLPRSMAF
jgi:hypothetical protein